MADFHHKVGGDGRQQFRADGVQAERHTVRAVSVDHAARVGILFASRCVNLAVHGDGFAALITTDLLALQVEFGQAGRIQKPQARIGGRDEKAIVQAHADVARRGVHEAAFKQAAAYAADLFADLRFGQVHANTVKALLKKSSVPKLPDLSAMCTPPWAEGA